MLYRGLHSHGQQPCIFIRTKESVYIRKELNSHRIGLVHQYGCRVIILEHQCGCHGVMRMRSIPQQEDFHQSKIETHFLLGVVLVVAVVYA